MEKDFGIRFTEDFYATKDDVKKALNITSIDSIWERVNEYRLYFSRQIDLKNIEHTPLNVTFCSLIFNKVASCDKKLNKLLVKYTRISYLNREKLHNFNLNSLLKIAKVVASNYNVKCDDDTLISLIENRVDTFPVEQLVIYRYIKALKYFQINFDQEISLDLIIKMYSLLRGNEFNVNEPSSYIRESNLNLKENHNFLGEHYQGAPNERIFDLLNDLVYFLKTSNVSPIIKACVAYYYFNYIKPFEYYNEEVASLLFKYILASNDNEIIPSFINIEEYIFANRKLIDHYSLESEKSKDLTYICNILLSLLRKAIQDLDEELVISKEEISQKEEFFVSPKNEEESFKEEIKEEINIAKYAYETKDIKGISFETKVAMPTLPVGLDEKDAPLVAQHLLEIYPSLKKAQADFYSRHCTLGKYYTISQFKEEEKVAYETARTSMDNLAVLGLYKKEQIKNKFVYTPVNLNK